jgi:hypothetical protein
LCVSYYCFGFYFLGWGNMGPSFMDAQSLSDTVSAPEAILSFYAAPVPASVGTLEVEEEERDYDALMGDEGAHLKREFDENAPWERPQKKMSPAKQGLDSTTSGDQEEARLQMLMAAQPQVWDEEQREVETQESRQNLMDAFNTSAFGTIEGEEGEDEDL